MMYEYEGYAGYNPSAEQIAKVAQKVENIHGTEIPSLSTLRDIQLCFGNSVGVGKVTIKSFVIEPGAPEHGAMRSDNHVKKYEAIQPAFCEECESTHSARVEYGAYHHIAGYHSVTCLNCDNDIIDEQWS